MLQGIVDWIIASFGIDGTRIGDSLGFFIYDSIKILILLYFMIGLIGYLRTYISATKIKKLLSGKSSNFAASIFGAVTPFCSCSSIPIFLGFIESGIPLGVSFSFLITSPLVNEYLVVLMFGFFGWKITALYVIFGILIGVVTGIILGRMNLEKHLVHDMSGMKVPKDIKYKTAKERFGFGLHEANSIVKKLWGWILVGVGIGALIHNYVAPETIQSIVGKGGIFTVPIATILGVPMYASCAAIVPVALVLFQKGMPLGTALAFMMATSALSFPEAVILRRAMKLKLIGIFFGTVALGIIVVGYLFNILATLV